MIEWVDVQVSWLQRRYGLNIIVAKAYLAVVTLVTGVMDASYVHPDPGFSRIFWILACGLIFGFGAWFRTHQVKTHGDYPENARKAMNINAIALMHREDKFGGFIRGFCVFFLFSSFLVVILSIIDWDQVIRRVNNFVFWFSLTSTILLDACSVLGPGDHSKEKNKRMSEDMVPDNLGEGL